MPKQRMNMSPFGPELVGGHYRIISLVRIVYRVRNAVLDLNKYYIYRSAIFCVILVVVLQ